MAARTYFDKPARSLDVLGSATLVGMLRATAITTRCRTPSGRWPGATPCWPRWPNAAGSTRRASGAAEETAAHRLRTPARSPRPGAALCPAGAPLADRVGRPPRLQHLHRRPGAAHHPRQPPAGPGHPGRGAPRQPAAGLADEAWRTGWGASPALVEAFIRESKPYRRAVASGQAPDAALKQLPPTRPSSTPPSATRPGCRWASWPSTRAAARCAPGSAAATSCRTLRPRAAGPPPAGLHLQALRVWRRLREGHDACDTRWTRAVRSRRPTANLAGPSDEAAPSGQPVSLRDGLVYSRNRITAQLMTDVGPARVARLARAMGCARAPRRCPRWPSAPAR